MDFKNLTYFKTVAEELSFTRAAEKLNMSQPPLSSQIKGLEDDLGVQLLIRGKRKLKLTEEGRLLLQRANQILELADKTRAEMATMHNQLSGSVSLGMVEGKAPFLASAWIAGFREEFPRVDFELWNGSSDDVIDRINRGLCDLGIIAMPYNSEYLEGISAAKEPWVVFLSEDHPLASREGDGIPLRELAGQPLIVPRRESRIEAIRVWFEEIDETPNIFCTMSNYVDTIALTKQNVGLAIFPQTKETTEPGVISRVIIDPPKIAEYVLVWRKGRLMTEVVRAFIEFVQDYIEEFGDGTDEFTEKFLDQAEIL
ncbi:MAG: LysR family transcriptional regulator [Anaerovoracaceae bacterium]|jgi:DNA-binding transcriptional LysR family regulator